MGKKQHQSDKLYLTQKEWSNFFGGKRKGVPGGPGGEFKRLPYDCCALSLTPFETPVCTPEGIIFDLLHIVPYIKKFGTNPVTGEPLDVKSLIRLHFHKNADGKYHCPVTMKEFTASTKIAAVRTSGNVFAYEAIEQFNIKPKFWQDLLTDESFVRKDIIILQDPLNADQSNLTKFHHIRHGLKLDDEERSKRKDPNYYLKTQSAASSSVMAELAASEDKWKAKHSAAGFSGNDQARAKPKDKEHSAHFSTGEASASFTSTSQSVRTSNTAESLEENVVLYSSIKDKGYVQLSTNLGDLNLELHCKHAPFACDSFLRHCASGYYNGTIFHRSIKHFMIQGGDPTGTGSGGESAFGKPFKDEISHFTHDSRGVLSMANSGPGTNGSQFFITYRPCNHLDGKHTVFGKLVGGNDVLQKMEAVETGPKDRPLEDIKIISTKVFVDPFRAADAAAKEKSEAELAAAEEERRRAEAPTVHRRGVGKYIAAPMKTKLSGQGDEGQAGSSRKKFRSGSSLRDFSGW
eukprot:m.295669 g.295669  ORF g.295669 m.295669 type:complete len:519 (+) comp13239_c0_seq1:197-1753(+)